MLANDIRQKLLDDFGAAEAASIEAEFQRFGETFRAAEGSPPSDRLVRCIVHLAQGEREALSNRIRSALVDWRDVIRDAEYTPSDERIRDFTLPFAAPTPSPSQPSAPQARAGATPESIVMAFIRAMNEWEQQAWDASRKARLTPDPESYWPEVTARLDRVFAEFCTPRKRPQGREESFQKPPEYDPNTERILGCETKGDKAHVDTERQAPLLDGGLRRYVLHLRSGKWLIDNVKDKDGERWTPAIL